MLEKLRSRAHHTYSTFCPNTSGGPQAPLPIALPDDIHDLSAFGGTKGGVINKSPGNSPPTSNAPSPPDSSLSSTVSGDIPANSAHHPQRSSHSPNSLLHQQSPLTYSSSGSSPLHKPDAQVMVQIPYGSGIPPPGSVLPGPVQQSQFELPPYPTAAQEVTPTQRAPDFRSSIFLPQGQSLPPSLEGGYLVSSETAHQQNPLVHVPTDEEILDFNFEALGLPSIPQQQIEYSQYPQLQQFQDIFMDDGTGAGPPQIPQDDLWWKFVDDLGIQRI